MKLDFRMATLAGGGSAAATATCVRCALGGSLYTIRIRSSLHPQSGLVDGLKRAEGSVTRIFSLENLCSLYFFSRPVISGYLLFLNLTVRFYCCCYEFIC